MIGVGEGGNKLAGFLTHATGGSNAPMHPGGPIIVKTAAITVEA